MININISNNLNNQPLHYKDDVNACFNVLLYIINLQGTFERNPLILPQGKIEVEIANHTKLNRQGDKPIKLEIEFSQSEVDLTLNNAFMIALGNTFISCNTALEDKFGIDKFQNNPTPDIAALRAVIYSARNAFAHRLTRPEWVMKPSYQQCWNLTYMNYTFKIDLSNNNGKILCTDDFGGLKNIFILFEFVRSLL